MIRVDFFMAFSIKGLNSNIGCSLFQSGNAAGLLRPCSLRTVFGSFLLYGSSSQEAYQTTLQDTLKKLTLPLQY